MEQDKNLKIKGQIIYHLNNLCFGMHGHLSALLKDLNYFFYFKKEREIDLSNFYLQQIVGQLQHIITLTRLMEELGGYHKILDYTNNRADYHKLIKRKQIIKNQAILDSISNQVLLKEEYVKVQRLINDEKIGDIIEKEIFNLKNNIESLQDKMVCVANN